MLWIYSPHWATAKYKGEWIQFPEYTPECYTDPKWGINPDLAYDCGKPHGEIWKVCLGRHEGQMAGRVQDHQELHDLGRRSERALRSGSISRTRPWTKWPTPGSPRNKDAIDGWAK